jgi:cation diffusion facilitator CzcD-associated flavoprotein CzcO
LTHHRVAVIGSGFSGLGMAIRLKKAGIQDFVVFERASDLGGTWRDNTYPGCQCDVESNLYSYSFAPSPAWSRTYAPQAEIWDYLRACAARFELGPHIRYRHEVSSATWDDAVARWRIETSGGPFSADVLVAAPGPLSEPSVPAIPGLGEFPGPRFHSANWDHGVELAGKRVAVIGTGASAIQFVPRIQPAVAQLHLFQRTPPWVLPHRDRKVRGVARALYRAIPGWQRLVRTGVYWSRELFVIPFMRVRSDSMPERLARGHLDKQVADPGLRVRLTPRYAIGCKRILISNNYYPAIQKPNVELVTDEIREVRGGSIVTAGGDEREVDVIILATGFRVTEMPFAGRVIGRDGKCLAEQWSGSPTAYRGTTVAGFPNLFLLLGPQHRPRPHVGPADARGTAPLCHGLSSPPGAQPDGGDRGPARSAGSFQRRCPVAPSRHGLERGRLPQLVPGPERQEHDDLARDELVLREATPALRPHGLQPVPPANLSHPGAAEARVTAQQRGESLRPG